MLGQLLSLLCRDELSDLHPVAPPRRKLNSHDSHVRVRFFEFPRQRLGIGLLAKRGDLDPERAQCAWAPAVPDDPQFDLIGARPGHRQGLCPCQRQINDSTPDKGTTVVNAHRDPTSIGEGSDLHHGAQWEGPVGCR